MDPNFVSITKKAAIQGKIKPVVHEHQKILRK
jgi:hypothetical protein